MTVGRDLVGPSFALGACRGTPAQNRQHVELLTSHGNYVYRVLETQEVDDNTSRVVKVSRALSIHSFSS